MIQIRWLVKEESVRSFETGLRKARLLSALLLGVTLGCAGVALGQGVRVNVQLDQSVNVLSPISVSLPAVMSDGAAFKPDGAPYTRLAGANAIVYPGSPGAADLYHWSTNTLTKYAGSNPPYIGPDANFGNFAKNLDKYGTALLVVNYGASLNGTGGGDPGEAAAWVAYANGDPADTRPIPKDKEGSDWHTVGFWATIRSQAPLETDDGFNFLRIAHPRPFGIALWQIGDHVYNNGFYGEKHSGEPDLHGPSPAKANDFGKLEKNPNLSPAFYGARVVDFARAMKSVDPDIKVGATLALVSGGPSDSEWGTNSDWGATIWARDWDDKVLQAGCGSMDFVTLDWQMGPMLPPDWKTLDEESLFKSTRPTMASILSWLVSAYKNDCPAGRLLPIAFSPAGIAPWPHVEHPVATTLWVADTYAILAETGAATVSWYEMHGNSMLSNDNKSFGPAFMGLEMLHIVAHNPGDIFVHTDSDSSTVAAHATRRRDGVVGIMLINEDPKHAETVTVTVSGGTIGSKGKRLDYGLEQQKAGAPLAQSEITGLGAKFTVSIPAYTVTDILIPPAS